MTQNPHQIPKSSTDERDLRIELAACYRLVALFGWDDLIFTHISAKVPGEENHFLINPYGLLFEEVTASSLVKVDLQGNIIGTSDYDVNPAGFNIHSAIHEVREDAGCVVHLHTAHGIAAATARRGLLPLSQSAQLILPDLAYHDYEGVSLDKDERPRLQRDLGEKNFMLLRNHGTLTVGRGCPDAFFRMYSLERSCMIQSAILQTTLEICEPSNSALSNNTKISNNRHFEMSKILWPSLLRKLNRVDQSYRD